ncbi:hypothetical protein RB628_05090 [Streptomyces sp. ADMS]|uniref:hypothetical protein n=1 Tax=Streptomyces sp. ADMS TaxID=3071415 RepID=UPI00296EEEFF|nr:hypothetical protein [Streptomyces sp. ADMS]MDW4904735.1 hypothetical protein [Streptomyces sp. ADMS]
MTPRLRTLRTSAALLALAAPALAASPHVTTPPYDIPYVARPAPDVSRAGSLAGEGRERPGRRVPAPPEETAYEETPYEENVPLPVPTTVPDDPRDTAALPAPVSDPVLRILPLGSGLVLIGLGLGLALLALRLRVRRT